MITAGQHFLPGLDNLFQWDPIGHVLHLGDSYVRLSPIEGRIFDLLLTNHNRTVPMEELVRHVLTNPNVDVGIGRQATASAHRSLAPQAGALSCAVQSHFEYARRGIHVHLADPDFIPLLADSYRINRSNAAVQNAVHKPGR